MLSGPCCTSRARRAISMQQCSRCAARSPERQTACSYSCMAGCCLATSSAALTHSFCGVAQGVSRLLQQGGKVRPTAAALAAAAAAVQQKPVSPADPAQQAPQPLVALHPQSQAVLPASTLCHETAQAPCNVGAAASAVNCTSSDACASTNTTSATATPAVDSPVADARQPQPPRRLTVQMLPFDAAAKAVVEAAGANPYLELANLK